jgi:hypothetical protein
MRPITRKTLSAVAALTGRAAVAIALFGTGACNTLMDLGRFDEGALVSAAGDASDDAVSSDAGNASGDKNLVLVLQRMAPHPTQLFEFRIVDASNRVQTRGLLDPLGEQDVTIHVPVGVPQIGGPYRLDFYADMNDTRSFDGIGSGTMNDHAWRIPLEPSTKHGRTVAVAGDDMTVTFLHDTVFTDIDTSVDGTPGKPGDTGLNATVNFVKLPASYQGVQIEARIANADTGRTVGFYRFPQSKASPFEAVIPGVVEGNVEYRISIYVDVNGNGEYDNPSTVGPDKAWCVKRSADLTKGLVFEFDPDLAGDGNCDVGPP